LRLTNVHELAVGRIEHSKTVLWREAAATRGWVSGGEVRGVWVAGMREGRPQIVVLSYPFRNKISEGAYCSENAVRQNTKNFWNVNG